MLPDQQFPFLGNLPDAHTVDCCFLPAMLGFTECGAGNEFGAFDTACLSNALRGLAYDDSDDGTTLALNYLTQGGNRSASVGFGTANAAALSLLYNVTPEDMEVDGISMCSLLSDQSAADFLAGALRDVAGLGASNVGFGQAAPILMPQQVQAASFQNQYWADGLLGDHFSPPPQVQHMPLNEDPTRSLHPSSLHTPTCFDSDSDMFMSSALRATPHQLEGAPTYPERLPNPNPAQGAYQASPYPLPQHSSSGGNVAFPFLPLQDVFHNDASQCRLLQHLPRSSNQAPALRHELRPMPPSTRTACTPFQGSPFVGGFSKSPGSFCADYADAFCSEHADSLCCDPGVNAPKLRIPSLPRPRQLQPCTSSEVLHGLEQALPCRPLNQNEMAAALRQVWHLPIEEASRQLSIGVTNMKKVCRELGIAKWPARKLRSMDALIAALEQLVAAEAAEEDSAPVVALLELRKEREVMGEDPTRAYSERFLKLRQSYFKLTHTAKRGSVAGQGARASLVHGAAKRSKSAA